ncbi:YaaC family protein [Cytobacillus sp. FSL R7-0696]|uniref:YaaC family protein n=1 Tax=Cytobacillus sp. FSL R7-0696 TaxID=2921691 RepID=UPI0030F93B58
MKHSYHNWQSYLPFFSTETTKAFLEKSYQNEGIEQASQKSFENTYPFIYYIEHGKVYYEQAAAAPLIIKPILYFYGLVHLIKACILTIDPLYPDTTSVLAHGVSTRKKKKQQYLFLKDEVKLQKSGLFPYMAEKMFHMKHLEGDKFYMVDLLRQIPEMEIMFQSIQKEQTFIDIKKEKDDFFVPITILNHYHMTESRFSTFLSEKLQVDGTDILYTKEHIKFPQNKEINRYFKYNIVNKNYSLPIERSPLNDYPELFSHYLVLYNLSMIARYETEWWNECIKLMTNNDYPFIHQFLDLTEQKSPFLIYNFLDSRNFHCQGNKKR